MGKHSKGGKGVIGSFTLGDTGGDSGGSEGGEGATGVVRGKDYTWKADRPDWEGKESPHWTRSDRSDGSSYDGLRDA